MAETVRSHGEKDNPEAWDETSSAWVKAAKDFFIPPLDFSHHKGQNGRICVVGGALEFTGAPYFSAMAALHMGMDLAYIITTPEAAGPIKTYSPELIVYPILPGQLQSGQSLEDALVRLENKAGEILKKCHVVVMGPGMGAPAMTTPPADEETKRDACGASGANPESGCTIQRAALTVLEVAMKENKFVVIDADMIRVLCTPPHSPSLQRLKNYRRCLLTPNRREFELLQGAFDSLEEPCSPLSNKYFLSSFFQAVQREQQRSCDAPKSENVFADFSRRWQPPPETDPSLAVDSDDVTHANRSPSPPSVAPCPSLIFLDLFPSSLKSFAGRLADLTLGLNGPNLLVKGPADVFVVFSRLPARSEQVCPDARAALATCGLTQNSRGSPKRSGGQGDVLGGILAAFVAWWQIAAEARNRHGGLKAAAGRLSGSACERIPKNEMAHAEGERLSGLVLSGVDEEAAGLICVMFNASLMVRQTAARAFEEHGRSMLAGHLLPLIGPVFRSLYKE
ncbi:carbohydrate kinase [Toxoplasma gondii ME49]|uniref:ATP-dependent (S)-NAD(P)H-hydrate dehydratase n=3 Tax=Toxoplasma gondii TaxID=5811 RepID=B6KB56_TOXGV|nr:carbohydrate kinase [Toxoplasma gondii ME49]EPT29323.1 carbohydrate kinase [Toxoplasma gondii ME49]ESS32177.1 carbohydrate kinase [Toxoplasma gondii VEG]KYF41753.1 carbohydrate kinase [Toxoplasma gondii ARI]CEL74497.1 TPA: carbohydrate kinase [Toxoplasma gondii VEG]|eukprot:XP_002365040.1 carbohydrate kinase [Toxoplasma gondii ME49]